MSQVENVRDRDPHGHSDPSTHPVPSQEASLTGKGDLGSTGWAVSSGKDICRSSSIKDPHVKSKSIKLIEESVVDFPGGAVVKNPPASAGDMGSSPGLGRSHMLRSN